MSSPIIQILNKASHDTIVAQSHTIPTAIYVSNDSLPICKAFQSRYEALAAQWSGRGVRFCQLEFSSQTSMLFKFAPNQLPVSVFMVRGRWCRTVMSAELPAMEAALEALVREAENGDSLG